MLPRGSRRGRVKIKNERINSVNTNEEILESNINRIEADIPVKQKENNEETKEIKNVNSTMTKFKPRMVKRVSKNEQEEVKNEANKSNNSIRGRGGKFVSDRGGRGRPEIVMTASGAFAMGPAESTGSRTKIQGPTRSGMRKIDNSNLNKNQNNSINLSDNDDFGDDDENDEMKSKTIDLNEITFQNEMAPSCLPWDPKRIHEKEGLIQERNQKKLLKLKQKKLSQEQDDEKETKPHLSSIVPSSSNLNYEKKETKRQISLNQIESKQEQLDELSNVGKQFLSNDKKKIKSNKNSNQGSEVLPSKNGIGTGVETNEPSPLYVFQFPRTFPKFEHPNKITKNEEIKTENKFIKKKKKPGLDDWLGWGKGGRRVDRMGVPLNPNDNEINEIQGQIGELVIRKSGRVQMIIANVAYDVLPGSKPNFHQEIAVIDPHPLSQFRPMFVLGPTYDKFIVAPDISSLLKRDQNSVS